ncbi:amino acid permease [Scytonema sp. UIC 10036]|uniref:APC family permease n=1 Tax=Scytonema sp. UIC 10036 TaxID=2304196 RepID=UPI0012DA2038|nr:amino acid permease [Scytonema sp. UIC 10036]MUG94904.1 amino acid permease [Scytonema sp. UIC 10036]
MSEKLTVPKPTLSTIDAGALIVGMVVGVGIFETPTLVAANAQDAGVTIFAWFLGGVMSLIGALCYAELATAYPDAGGTYYYLMRAFGKNLAFLFAWARMAIIQTGSIALLAFVFGDYASQMLPLGEFSSALYASGAIALLTVINLLGLKQGKRAQNWLTVAKILGLLLVIVAGIVLATTQGGNEAMEQSTSLANASSNQTGNFGLAMVFVLLTYGGWNEAAYISAEVREAKRNMVLVLLGSIIIITAIYLLINFAYLHGLGLVAMQVSKAPAAELMRRAWGNSGAVFVSFLIAVSALGTANATIFTGARTNYALGRDFLVLGFLGKWGKRTSSPSKALILQSAIAILLVVYGAIQRKGFSTMVDYTAPVFWFFFLLSAVSLLVLRFREPETQRPFRVPLYPVIPLLFCAICGYMLQSSLAYTGSGARLGIVVLLTGIPVLLLNYRISSSQHHSNIREKKKV